MIRMLALEVSELGRGLHMLDAILQGRGRHDKATSQRAGAPPPAPVDEATRRALQDGAAEAIVQCAKLMTILAGGVTHQLIELGGGDQSLDFWTFSIALEVACQGRPHTVHALPTTRACALSHCGVSVHCAWYRSHASARWRGCQNGRPSCVSSSRACAARRTRAPSE